jgi:hypothetical protein
VITIARRVRGGLSILGCALLLGAATGTASAQDITPAQRDQFAHAQTLYDAKDYAAALPLFEDLLKQTQSPNARLYVARALRDLGRLPQAFDQMTLTVREAGARAQTEPKYESTRDAAAGELAQLQDRVAHVVVALADPPPGTSAYLDDELLTEQRLAGPITVVPGVHRVEVRSPGLDPVRREVNLRGGETKTEAIALRKQPDAEVKPPPTTTTSGGEVRIVGIVTAGLGVASLATFGATFALASERFATLEDECGSARCREARYADVIDEGKTFELISNVTVIVGAVLVAGSIPMIILGGPSESAPAAAVVPVPGGVAFALRGVL